MTSEEIATAWDARDHLLEELTQTNCLPSRTLYIRRNDGGTLAIGLLPRKNGLITIEWKDAGYRLLTLRQPVLRLDPFEQKATGFGGMFGFGEKGAHGWSIRLLDGGTVQAEAEVLPNITAITDLLIADDPFFTGKRKPRVAPLGQLRPEDGEVCAQVLSLWERLVLENG